FDTTHSAQAHGCRYMSGAPFARGRRVYGRKSLRRRERSKKGWQAGGAAVRGRGRRESSGGDMSAEEQVDGGRRHFLLVATTVTGLAGAGMAAVPFLASWKPSARAQALGAPVEQDISKMEAGAVLKVTWRGQAIFSVRRTPQMLETLDSPEPLRQL